MNRDTLKGQWNQMKGRVQETWGKLTDDEIEQAEGNWDQLVGKIQEKYGESKEAVEKKLQELDA